MCLNKKDNTFANKSCAKHSKQNIKTLFIYLSTIENPKSLLSLQVIPSPYLNKFHPDIQNAPILPTTMSYDECHSTQSDCPTL